MKQNRYIAAILAVAMMLCVCLSACGSSDPTVSDTTTTTISSQFKGKLLEKYIKYVNTGAYMYATEGTASDGSAVPVTVSTYKSKYKMITVSSNDATFQFLRNGSTYYVIIPDQSCYCKVTEQGLKTYVSNLFVSNYDLTFEDYSYKATGTQTLDDGVTYTYEDYYYPKTQKTVRFFFTSDGTLEKRCIVASDGLETELFKFEIYGNVTEKSMQIDSGYTDGGTTLEDTLMQGGMTA